MPFSLDLPLTSSFFYKLPRRCKFPLLSPSWTGAVLMWINLLILGFRVIKAIVWADLMVYIDPCQQQRWYVHSACNLFQVFRTHTVTRTSLSEPQHNAFKNRPRSVSLKGRLYPKKDLINKDMEHGIQPACNYFKQSSWHKVNQMTVLHPIMAFFFFFFLLWLHT